MTKKIIVKILAPAVILISNCLYCFAADKFLEAGASVRLRYEYWENFFDFENATDDIRSYFRFKESVWGRLNFTDNLSLYGKLTDEFKVYAHAPASVDTTFDINEIIFDNLYFNAKNIFGLPVDMRIGRQDFIFVYGEGFLIMDGTPMDGSRTYYFNAAKAVWHMGEKNSLDFLYITNPNNEQYLVIINEQNPKQLLNYTDEEAFVAYLKSDFLKNAHIEAYYIYKHEDGQSAAKLQAQEGEINTVGSFVKYNISPFVLRGQLAYQYGSYGSNDRKGLGGYLFLDIAFKETMWAPKISIGGLYLSGDNPSTAKNEGWNPLFSRWPWMSELYLFSYVSESGIGYWTNLVMWRVEIGIVPFEKAKLRVWYNFLRANEIPVDALFGTGKERGHLLQARADYKIGKHVSTYFLAEYFIPATFYKSTADNAMFLRTELRFKF
jgi:hypothetical protein